jgi:UPF0755 protein
MKMILSATSIFAVAVSVSLAFFSYQFLRTGYSSDQTLVLFDVNPGQSMPIVAQNLENAKLIKSAKLFNLYSRFRQMNPKLKRGEYALHAAMTPDEVLAVITSGKSVARNFTIAEGLNMWDIATLLEKNGYGTRAEALALFKDQAFIQSMLGEKLESLEGYLFPETYKVTKFDSQKDIVTQMVRRFLTVYAEIQPDIQLFNQTYPHRKWTRNQLVTFASIVEKETGAKHERPLVASVFHNRLDKNMRLQTDPTVLYGIAAIKGEMPNNITKKDLLTPTRHNTYTNYGLPVTPISNPGKEALQASLKPATSKFLYFVSHNDGTHQFSENLEAHNAAVKTFQIDPKARAGKSWRDLGKKGNK